MLFRFPRQTYAAALAAMALVPALSFFWSENSWQWMRLMKDKSVFVLLPFAFTGAAFLRPEHRQTLLRIFLLMCSAASAGIVIYYFTHQEEVIRGLYAGRPFPTPTGHIRLALMLAFGSCIALKLYFDERKLLYLVGLFLLAAGILFLSARSGVLALLCGLPAVLFAQFPGPRKWIFSSLFLLLVIPSLWLAVELIPPLKQRAEYMRYDIEQILQGNTPNTSDGMRWQSLKTAWELFVESPLLGTGLGDLEDEVQARAYAQNTSWAKEVWRVPHNQWMYILASCGLFGLLVFGISFLVVFLSGAQNEGALWWSLHLILLSSFLTEYTIEEQVGAAFYLFWILIFKKT